MAETPLRPPGLCRTAVAAAAPEDYARLLVEQLPLIEQVVRSVGRRHQLTADEIEELSATICLKLIDHDYEVLRKFEGRSSLRTYLTMVVHRHALDERAARSGKWRACAGARRLGHAGVLLDRLLNRDGVPFDQAAEIVRAASVDPLTDAALDAMRVEVPDRARRRFVGDDHLETVPADTVPSPSAALEHREAARLLEALAACLDALPDADRLLVKLRYQQGLSVPEIARLQRTDPKPLYRRLDHLAAELRRQLDRRGVAAAASFEELRAPELDLDALWTTEVGETAGARPSPI